MTIAELMDFAKETPQADYGVAWGYYCWKIDSGGIKGWVMEERLPWANEM